MVVDGGHHSGGGAAHVVQDPARVEEPDEVQRVDVVGDGEAAEVAQGVTPQAPGDELPQMQPAEMRVRLLGHPACVELSIDTYR